VIGISDLRINCSVVGLSIEDLRGRDPAFEDADTGDDGASLIPIGNGVLDASFSTTLIGMAVINSLLNMLFVGRAYSRLLSSAYF
jgi:hypothetical protein